MGPEIRAMTFSLSNSGRVSSWLIPAPPGSEALTGTPMAFYASSSRREEIYRYPHPRVWRAPRCYLAPTAHDPQLADTPRGSLRARAT